MSDALTDGGLLQVGPASVDESLDEGSPTDSIKASVVSAVDSIPPEESVVPDRVNDNGTQDVVDFVDETPAAKQAVSDNGTRNVADTFDITSAEENSQGNAVTQSSTDGSVLEGEDGKGEVASLPGVELPVPEAEAPQQEGIGTPLGTQAAKTAPAAGFFPRLIASITHRPQSKKALIITLLLFSLLLA